MAVYQIIDGRQVYNERAVDNRFFGIDNMEYVELKIVAGSTGQAFFFADQPQLDGMEIQAIETWTENDFPSSFITQGLALPTTAQFQAAALTLYESQKYDLGGGAFKDGVKYLPLTSLHRTINGTDPYVYDLPIFACNRVQWLKSGIVLNQVVTFAEDMCFAFAVYYSSKVPTVR